MGPPPRRRGGATVLRYGPVSGIRERAALRAILTQCFEVPAKRWTTYLEDVGWDDFRRVVRRSEIVAGLARLRMSMWFGGRTIPTGGIAAVGVPPEERGSGAAFALMRGILEELRADGVALSALYASTQRLYRKAGFELAGSRVRYRLPVASLPAGRPELPVHPLRPIRRAVLEPLYRARAEAGAGFLERPAIIWRRALEPTDESAYAYLLGSRERPEGYIVFSQERLTSGYDIHVRDLVCLTPAALRSAWAFLASHRSMARHLDWYGPPGNPMAAVLPEQTWEVAASERWMLRVVDPARALRARGYPPGVVEEVALELVDEILPENSGGYILRVADGRGTVTRAAPSRFPARRKLMASPRGLAPLYSGLLGPSDLMRLGWIEGSGPALETATRVFAGPPPWMPDTF